MTPFRDYRLLALFALTAGCVTVNVYFPAAAAEKAADRIIQEVYGPEQPGPDAPSQPDAAPAAPDESGGGAQWVLDFLVPPAHAQQPNIDISTPGINKLKGAMTQRHRQLEPFYAGGAVGMDNSGLITLRDPKAVSIKDRNTVNQLVTAENRDRNALYAEIAKANGHPEWEQDIRGTFARRWVANAPPGWYFQDSGGSWKQK
ncbi:MAG: YdbL family protein [Burkholderiales bacterium]